MPQITYAAVLALTRIYGLSGIDYAWEDFLRAYRVRDLGVEAAASRPGGFANIQRMDALKRFHSSDPKVQKWFEDLVQITIWELVTPGRNALGRRDQFWDKARAQAEIDTLQRELNLNGYRIEDNGDLTAIGEDVDPRKSDVDDVTGIPLRRFLNQAAQRIWEQAQATGVPVAALFIDADDFKAINEISHPTGDKLLRAIAQAVDAAVRLRGVVGRWGTGDEIVAILKNLSEDEAFTLGERIRKDVEKINVEGIAATVSVGVASSSRETRNVEELWSRADKAVNMKKTHGKNRTYRFSETRAAG